MLSCKEVAERASALIDGELGMLDLLQMRLHLAMCKGCGSFIRQMRVTRDLIEGAVETEDPASDATERGIAAILARAQDPENTGR